MNAQLAASCLGLTITLCDIYLTRKQEKALIWSSPFRLTTVKALYIFSRYLGLTCQMYNVARSAYWRHRYITLPQRSCTSHLFLRTLGVQTLLETLHIILMLRVYALYNKSHIIALILVLLHALRFSVTIWTVVRYWDIYKADFDYICFTTESLELKVGLAIFILSEVLYQSVIHTLIAKKTWTLPSTWSKTPTLTSVLTRDGFYVFFAIFVSMVAFAGASYEKGPAPLFIQPLVIFTLSCAIGSRGLGSTCGPKNYMSLSMNVPGAEDGIRFSPPWFDLTVEQH
ncbi:hypothetical protein WG66_005562 [Moniliophthora roreri]|nr:hypothetical protein WG66_005562 [Moniliophthora roreri]